MILDKLSRDIVDALKICSDVADKEQIKLFLIGGVVRDLLLDKQTLDIDVCIEADAITFSNKLKELNYIEILQIQPDLHTTKIKFKNNVVLDLASTRKEIYPQKSHLPLITEFFCPLVEDIKRRDFTLNSIAISLNKNDFGEIIDYLGGVNDLENKKLKLLHDNSFIDDPSRIIRALKYASRLNLELDEYTTNLKNDYLNNLPQNICYSRIMSEIEQVFTQIPKIAIEKFYEWNLEKLFYCEKNNNYKNLEKSFEVLNIMPKWFGYFAFVLSSAQNFGQICEMLNLQNSQKKILFDIAELMQPSNSTGNFEIYKKFENKDENALAIYCANTQNEDVIKYENELSKIKLEITGDDLIKIGLKPSNEFKKILDILLKEKLNGKLLKKEDEISFVKKHFINC